MSVVSEHYTLGADEAEAVWFTGCLATLKGLGAQTGGVLAAVEFTHPPGYATPRHVHHDADEAFYVLEGSLRGFCGDRTWRATKGASFGSHVASPMAMPLMATHSCVPSRLPFRPVSTNSSPTRVTRLRRGPCLRPAIWTSRNWWPPAISTISRS